MTDLWSDPTDDMPALAARVDRRLLLGMGLAFAVWLGTIVAIARVSYAYGASTNAPLCLGTDSITVKATRWPKPGDPMCAACMPSDLHAPIPDSVRVR